LYLLFIVEMILFSEIEYIFVFLSFPPDINNFPEGEKSIDLTGALWIFIKWLKPWMLFFQSFIVVSSEQDAIKCPKGFIVTSFMEFLCEINLIGLELGFNLNRITLPSSLPVTIWAL